MSLITERSNGRNKYSLVEDIIIVRQANERKTIEQIAESLKKCGFERTESSLQYRTGRRVLRKKGVTFESIHGVDKAAVQTAMKTADELMIKAGLMAAPKNK